MVRGTLAPVVLVALAGCGGGSPDPPDERPAPDRRFVSRELRSPDARSPFVMVGGGVWDCLTDRRIQLAISADGEVSLSTPGMVLASVASTRTVVNRACDRARRVAAPRGATARHGHVGATLLRCDAPGAVLVDFADGDLTVRTRDGRFLAGAAVRPDLLGVAAYWAAGCVLPD